MKSSSLIKDLVYNENKPAISVLFETENTKEIRIAMKSGQIMKEHKTAFPIVVEIFDGEIDFGVDGKTHHLQKGDILSLEGSVPHDLICKSDSIVRLSLSKLDNAQRVRDVVK